MCFNTWKVDLGLENFIEEVAPGIEGHMLYDFDHLPVGVGGPLYGGESLSVMWPRSAATLAAKRTAASAFGSFEVPLRFGAPPAGRPGGCRARGKGGEDRAPRGERPPCQSAELLQDRMT
jgi:hypothetical protein